MKNMLHSPLFCLINSYLELNKKLLVLFLFGAFLFTSNLAHAQLPLFDDFESGWGNWNDGGNDCFRATGTQLNGNRYAQLRDNSNSSNMTSDVIDLTPYTSVTIDFIFRTRNFANGENFFVEYDDGTGSGYTVIGDFIRGTNINNNTTYTPSITLNSGAYNLTNNARFRIRCDASNNSDILRVDDVNITGVLPPCIEPTNQPTNLTFNNITGASIDGDFDAATSNPDSYLVVYSTSNITPTPVDGTDYTIGNNVGLGYLVVSNDNSTSFSATGLDPLTTYYFYIFSFNGNCTGGSDYLITSPLNGSETTIDPYCRPTGPTDPNHWIDDFETFGGVTNIANINSGNSTNNYGDYTNLSVSQYRGADIYFYSDFEYLTALSRFGVRIWVDYNDDGDFDDGGERVYSSDSYIDPASGFFNIPVGTAPGDYRMRIVADRNDNTPDPCSLIIDRGEIEDYTLTVLDQVPCVEPSDQPTNLTFNSITEVSMNLVFDQVNSYPDDYLVIYNTTGITPTITDGVIYTPGSVFSGNTVVGNDRDTSYTLLGLTENTLYYFYIFSFNSACTGGPDYNTNSPLTGTQATTEACSLTTVNGTSTLSCPSVEAGGLGLNGADTTINCNAGSNTTNLEANYLDIGDTSSYNVESIAYVPPYQFGCLANPVSVNIDDTWSPVVNLPFDFCFYGNTYNSCVIGSNGVISFDTSLANSYSGWVINNNIPNNVNTDAGFFGPSIFGAHHDVDPSIGGEIGYQLITLDSGCQALVASWYRVPMYDNNNLLYSGMIVFYEDTNIIEVYIDEKNVDGTWNAGNATIGLQADSTEATTVFGRNSLDPNWTVRQEAWRFVPSGNSITDLKWYENSISAANEIIDPNDDGEITVTPSSTTTYFAEVTYTLCDGSTKVETDQTTVNIIGAKVWDGSESSDWDDSDNWTPSGAPVITDCVIIPVTPNDPVISNTTDGNGFNLEIENGATLTQQSNSSLTIEDKIVIDPNGDLEVNDSASIIQITDVATNENTGSARFRREALGIDYFDYIYWSSPIDVFDIEDISPATPSFAMYKWSPTVANGTAGLHGTWVNTQEDMVVGQGYIVRGLLGGSIANTVEFDGVLNNGQISIPITRGTYNGADYMGVANTATADDDNWNLLGNPYPSAISLTDFVTANPAIDGTLYFWRHLTPISSALPDPFHENYVYNYSSSDYLAENGTGSVPVGFDDDLIAAGQGFFAMMLHSASTPNTVTFSNTMRGNYDNSEFYRSNSTPNSSSEKHRIWLDFVDDNTSTANSILVGYVEGATNGIDRLYDGRLLKGSGHKFYSIISDQDLVINGKGLPFNNTDIIPLGYQTLGAGNYSITINSLDGLFNDTIQDIFLEDTELSIIHNLRESPYNFTSDEGTYNERFIIRFTEQVLSISDQDILADLKIKSINSVIDVKSSLSVIKTFELFDLTGRTIHKNLKVDDKSFKYQNGDLSNGAYIVQVSLENGSVVSKKIVI